jgi:hypothetical protein
VLDLNTAVPARWYVVFNEVRKYVKLGRIREEAVMDFPKYFPGMV